MPNVVMLSVIMLSVVRQNVVMLNVLMLSVVAPENATFSIKDTEHNDI
jgi:hypothetical protein